MSMVLDGAVVNGAGGCSTLAGQPLPEASLCSVIKLEQWGNIGNRFTQRASALTLSFSNKIFVNLMCVREGPGSGGRAGLRSNSPLR